MKQEDILLQKCLQYLEALPSIQASLKESSYVLDNHRSIAAKLRLKASSRGEIIFLQQFGDWNAFNDVDSLADPLLIHAELMRENDERLSETAERLFDRYIEDRRKNA